MSLKHRFLLVTLFVLLALLLSVWLTPFAVSHGVRWWIWWRARQEGFIVNIDKIDAPFLRPVAIRQLRLRNAHDDTFRIDLTITDATFDLNFKHILLHRARSRHPQSVDSGVARGVAPKQSKCASDDQAWLGNTASNASGRTDRRRLGGAD